MWWRWGRVELPVQSPSAATTTSVSDRFRQPSRRGSALSRLVQPRVSRSSLLPGYATLIRAAAPLNDASTTRGTEVASTLTLPPKRRGRESTACWQLLRFAACLTRPDGTSARVHCQLDPVETTHPHRIERTPASGGESSRGRGFRQGAGRVRFPFMSEGSTRSSDAAPPGPRQVRKWAGCRWAGCRWAGCHFPATSTSPVDRARTRHRIRPGDCLGRYGETRIERGWVGQPRPSSPGSPRGGRCCLPQRPAASKWH